MSYYHYTSLVKSIIRNLLVRGEILVAERYSIEQEDGYFTLRNRRGATIEAEDPIREFINSSSDRELFQIVSRKCEWI